jgi:hypothetical protein
VLLNRRITDPMDLLAFHRRFFGAGPMVGRVVTTVELVVAILLVGELAAWPVEVTAALALGAAVLAGVLTATGSWRLAEDGVACPAGDTRRSGDPQPRSAGARGAPRAPVLVREPARPHREPMHQHQH